MPSSRQHQPRHLVPCLPWHGQLAQVGLSRELQRPSQQTFLEAKEEAGTAALWS